MASCQIPAKENGQYLIGNCNISGSGSNYHTMSWNVYVDGGNWGVPQSWQNLAAWFDHDGSQDYVWNNPSGGSATLYRGNTAAEGSFTIWHIAATSTYFFIKGKTPNTATSDANCWLSLPSLYTSPSAPTATNLTSDGTAGKAYSRVSTSYWGQNASRRNYEVICNSAIKATDYSNSPGLMYWTLPSASTNTLACAINTWYGRAVNNQIMWTDSGAKYIATPSAPALTLTPGSGTSPQITISGTVRYKGGEQNSTSANTSSIVGWQFGFYDSTQGDNVVPTNLIYEASSDTTYEYTYERGVFKPGINYRMYVRAINALGGYGRTTSSPVYCPSGVYGNNVKSAVTTRSVTIRAGANNAGTVGSATGGAISCYSLSWGTDPDNLNNHLPIQTSTDFTITGLEPAQTVFYEVTAWNVYGLSATSNIDFTSTMPRYTPLLSDLTLKHAAPVGVGLDMTVEQTGGLELDESTLTSIKCQYRAVSDTAWTDAGTYDVSLKVGDTYSIPTVWSGYCEKEGDYEIMLTLTNADGDEYAQTILVPAPTTVTASGARLVTDEPIQVLVAGYASSTPDLESWEIINVTDNEVQHFENSAKSVSLKTHKHLSYETTYSLKLTAFTIYGTWRTSNAVTATTAKRFQWYRVQGEKDKTATMSFKGARSEAVRPVIEMYLVRKNALGRVATGDSLKGMKLSFITQPLHYRPENVAAIKLSNNTSIEYKLLESENQYVFGIWQGDTLKTRFFSDEEGWAMTEYRFGNSNLTVSSITHTGFGLCSSAPFSTTVLEEIKPWEAN